MSEPRADDGPVVWSHASLTLAQNRWPGRGRAQWVARTARSEVFRTPDLLAAMDRLGADGWEMVVFAPAWDDRPAGFYFKARTTATS